MKQLAKEFPEQDLSRHDDIRLEPALQQQATSSLLFC